MSSSTSNSEMNVAGPKRFLIRVAMFLLPLLALWLPLEWFLWQHSESLPAASVLEIQLNADHEVLYGRGLLNQQFNVYKVTGWKKFKPRIVAVGSSRVWRLRKYAFHPREADFYNAGGLLQCAADFCEMAKMIDDGRLPKPDTLIVGFDPWWFKTNHRNVTWLDSSSLKDDAYKLAARRNAIKRLWEDPSLFHTSKTLGQNHLGIYGRIGFRLDGSMKVSESVVGEFTKNPIYVDRESPPIVDRIYGRTGRFSDSKPSEVIKDACVSAIELLRANGVRLIAFFPPFSDESWAAITASENIGTWMDYYVDQVIPDLSAVASEVIGFGHSSSLQSDDTFFLDGMHAGEVLSTLQWVRLVEQHQDDEFYRQLAPQYVRQQIKQRCSTPLAYDEER